MSMSAQNFNMLWAAIDVLEPQEHISLCRALSYPNLTKKARAERDLKLQKAAFPRDIYKKEVKDASFLLQKLGGKNG